MYPIVVGYHLYKASLNSNKECRQVHSLSAIIYFARVKVGTHPVHFQRPRAAIAEPEMQPHILGVFVIVARKAFFYEKTPKFVPRRRTPTSRRASTPLEESAASQRSQRFCRNASPTTLNRCRGTCHTLGTRSRERPGR